MDRTSRACSTNFSFPRIRVRTYHHRITHRILHSSRYFPFRSTSIVITHPCQAVTGLLVRSPICAAPSARLAVVWPIFTSLNRLVVPTVPGSRSSRRPCRQRHVQSAFCFRRNKLVLLQRFGFSCDMSIFPALYWILSSIASWGARFHVYLCSVATLVTSFSSLYSHAALLWLRYVQSAFTLRYRSSLLFGIYLMNTPSTPRSCSFISFFWPYPHCKIPPLLTLTIPSPLRPTRIYS